MRHIFNIADHLVVIDFPKENDEVGIHLLPFFEPFRVKDGVEDNPSVDLSSAAFTCEGGGKSAAERKSPMLHLTVDLDLLPLPREQRQRIRDFDTGNGCMIVDRLSDGGYQYVIRDLRGKDCALLVTNADFSRCRCNIKGTYAARGFGLNNALMVAYAFSGSFHKTVVTHASLIRHKGIGYAFTAKSGTGKSTQTANWLRMIPDCDLMNDDNPVIRIIDGKAVIYGSPWSGKTPCYRRVSAPLGAMMKVVRATENRVERIDPFTAFTKLLPSCFAMKWDKGIYPRICDIVTAIVSCVPVYILYCTASPESAVVCKNAIAADDN